MQSTLFVIIGLAQSKDKSLKSKLVGNGIWNTYGMVIHHDTFPLTSQFSYGSFNFKYIKHFIITSFVFCLIFRYKYQN